MQCRVVTLPLVGAGQHVIDVDFNAASCRISRQNVLYVVRGDAFDLPLGGCGGRHAKCVGSTVGDRIGIAGTRTDVTLDATRNGENLLFHHGNGIILTCGWETVTPSFPLL